MTSSAKTCPTPTARQKRVWDKSASGYDKQIAFFEKNWFTGGREWLAERARGRVLEVAVGTGRNLPHYPADVTGTGTELSPAMLAIARQRAAGLGRNADLHEGDAEHLPLGDSAFDTVVCALSLCTIPSPAAAVGEMRRVLAPAGACGCSTTSAAPGRRSTPPSGSSNASRSARPVSTSPAASCP